MEENRLGKLERRQKLDPVKRLVTDMEFLDALLESLPKAPEDKIDWKPGDKAPVDMGLLNFKMKMEKEIRKICRKIENRIGFEVPAALW